MADSFAANDQLRIAFDGANNATTATDAVGHTLTFTGTAKLTTANKMFGTAAVVFDGTASSTVDTAVSTDFDISSGDWCIDFFLRNTGAIGYPFTIQDSTNAGVAYFTMSSSFFYSFQWGAGGNQVFGGNVAQSLTAPAYIQGEWNHWAFVRSGSTISIYLNGTLLTAATGFSGGLGGTGPYKVNIGGRGGGNGSICTIDAFRFTKGQARYTGPFVPPVNGTFDSLETGTVTQTTLGPRTIQVSAYGATNFDSVIAQADVAIKALGWTLWDVHYRGSVYMVYRALNADGTTFKYTAFIWDKSRIKVTQISMEGWDLSTKAITNECWNNLRADGVQGFNVMNCDLIFYGNARYLGLMTYLQGQNGIWSMCTEIEREAPEDTAGGGVPCWGMTYGSTFLGNFSNVRDFIRLPRAKDGTTGVNASRFHTTLTSFGAWGDGTFGVSSAFTASFNASMNQRNAIYGWNSAKKLISAVKSVKFNNVLDSLVTVSGRLFGLKAAPILGNTMDKVVVNVDANLFPTTTGGGTDTDHWILPHNHVATDSTLFAGQSTSIPTVTSWPTSQSINAICYTGQFAYLATNVNGVYKVDLTGGGGVTQIAGSAAQYFDCCFDGRYVYMTHTLGVSRYDTTNSDAGISLTLGTGGLRAVCYNGKNHLFVSEGTAATATYKIYKIEIQSFTSVANLTPRKLYA